MRTVKITKVFETTSTDPDDARRGKLLNILIIGLETVLLLGIIAIGIVGSIEGLSQERVIPLLQSAALAFIGVLVIYLINRYWSGDFAGALFLILMTAVITLTEEPQQIVEGRSTFLFTVPILMASVILRPWASFVMAGVVSIVIAGIDAFVLNSTPGIPTMLGFFTFALVAWLSARSLESALHELRAINEELDQRVEQRTEELRDANRQLAQANEHLRELDRLKSHFVSMVSHELRTPLTSIQGYAEMLQAEIYGAVSEKQEQALDRVLINTRQLIAIVNDLLNQARIEAGLLALHPTPFSPEDLVANLHSTMQPLTEAEGLQLTAHVADNVPSALIGDSQRLQQILVNLVNNAIKFTSEGSIDVRIYRSNEQYWAMEVADTGAGIPEDAIEYIFEPFRQVDGSATRRHKGVGLGLSIVKQLVELMNGNIRVESEIGKGSTFIIQLPLHVSKKETT
jgi:signal transduction histidine kinase